MRLDIRTPAWYGQRHHRPGGFANVWGENPGQEYGKLLKWGAQRAFRRKTNRPPPVRSLVPGHVRAPAEGVRVTWLGHAATLVQSPDVTILTDPHLGRRASPVSFAGPERLTAPPLSAAGLPPVDVVLLSHDHYDHLDAGSIRALMRLQDPLFLVPLGVGPIVRRLGARRVAEFDWWQHAALPGVEVHCAPARHFSGRTFAARDTTLWASWYLGFGGGLPTVYFAGDTAYADHFEAIRERLGAPDAVLMPVGAYRPRWFMQPVHVDPAEAAQAFLDLRAGAFIPIHWGTFDLADEPVQEPAEEIRRLAAEHGFSERLRVLDVGGQWQVSARLARLDRASAPSHPAAGDAHAA